MATKAANLFSVLTAIVVASAIGIAAAHALTGF